MPHHLLQAIEGEHHLVPLRDNFHGWHLRTVVAIVTAFTDADSAVQDRDRRGSGALAGCVARRRAVGDRGRVLVGCRCGQRIVVFIGRHDLLHDLVDCPQSGFASRIGGDNTAEST